MKNRTLASALTLTLAFGVALPLTQLVSVPEASAQDKSKSPAKQEIADADYVCKELKRLLDLSGWESKENVIGMIEEQVKTCDEAVAKVKKADPKWDVSAWTKLIADGKARAKKAREALGTKKPAAPTGPDPKNSPAYDDIVLTQGAMTSLEKKLADKTDWATDQSARESAKTAIEGVEGGIGRIKKKDPKWDLSAWEKTVKEARARLKVAQDAVDKKESVDKKNYDTYQAYTWTLSKVETGIELLQKVNTKPADLKIESEQIFGNMVKAIAGVEALDKECKEKKYATVPVPGFYKNIKPAAVEGCKLAAGWKEGGKKYVEVEAKGGAKNESARLTKVIENMKAGKSIEANDHGRLLDPSKAVEAIKGIYDKGGKTFDFTTEASTYDPIKTVAESYPKALEEAGKTSRWDKAAKLQDAGITAAVASDHKKGGPLPEGQVIRVASVNDWFVEKDVWGVPVKRTRSADALVKIKGEGYCRLYARSFESFFKNGVWSKPSWIMAGSTFKISSCQ